MLAYVQTREPMLAGNWGLAALRQRICLTKGKIVRVESPSGKVVQHFKACEVAAHRCAFKSSTRASLAPLLFLISVLPGCAGLAAGPRSPIPDIERTIVGSSDAANDGLQANYTAAEVSRCFGRSLEREEAEARDCRDRIVQALVTAINLRYAEFEVGFFDANRYTSLATTLAALGLSTAGAVSGAGVTQALSAAAAGMTGARTAFNREVMQEQTSAALLTAMRAQRNIADLRIRSGLRLSAREYPPGVALSDVYALYRAGTIPGAIAGVTQAVGVQGQAAQEQLATGMGFARGAAAVTLRRWVNAPGLSDAASATRIQEVKAAARAEGFGDVVVASFLRDETPGNEDRLNRVARRLGLTP